MADPHPDPRPFVAPIGIDDVPLAGGESTLTVTAPLPGTGGTVVVASDALLARAAGLRRLSEDLRNRLHRVNVILRQNHDVVSETDFVPDRLHGAIGHLESAAVFLNRASDRAEHIASAILQSQEVYTEVEALAKRAMHVVDEEVAWTIGLFVRVNAVPLAIGAINAATSAAIAGMLVGVPPGKLGTVAQDFFKQHPRLLTSPATVGLTREVASDVDGFDAGFDLVPPIIAEAKEFAGVTGVKSSAATVIADANVVGLFRETPVVVRRTTSFDYNTPPKSVFDRSINFPDPHEDANGEQIRIDKYTIPGQPDRYDVYVAGTVTFDPKTGTEPFDATSDLRGVAGLSTASTVAVEQAMAKAGVTSTTPVILNGYSQGGLVASAIAASGNYDVKAVLTFGAPSGQVHIPASIPVLSVRNSEDIVPATSGYDVNRGAVVVQRSAFADQPIPTDKTVPAHELALYQQTAVFVDKAGSPEIRRITKILDNFGDGSTNINSSLWLGTRTDGSSTILPLVPTPSSSLPAREAVAK